MYEAVGMKQGKVTKRTITSEYYCGRCGYPVSDHDSYCSECGGLLNGDANAKMVPNPEHRKWLEKAKHVSREELPSFIDEIMEKGDGYSDLIYAVSSCCIATMSVCGKGMTGYQASWVPLIFLQNVNGVGTKVGFKVVDYDNMMYPQYEDYFNVTLSRDMMEALQEEAVERLGEYADRPNDDKMIAPSVLKHWIKLASGTPPYGLNVEEG